MLETLAQRESCGMTLNRINVGNQLTSWQSLAA
jgi:hypothetical protein